MTQRTSSLFFLLLLSLLLRVQPVRAQSYEESPVSCTVRQYTTSLGTLPLNGNRSATPVGSGLEIGRNYQFTIDVVAKTLTPTTIQSLYMQTMAGADEPINILGFRNGAGPCSIDSDKRISCTNLRYQFAGTSSEVMEVLVRPFADATKPYTSVLFSVETDKGTARCAPYNKVSSPASPTPTSTPAPFLPPPANFRVVGYRSVTDAYLANYKQAVIAWDKVPGSIYYGLWRYGVSTPYSFGGTRDTEYVISFVAGTEWDVAVHAQSSNWIMGEASQTLRIAYPGQDTLPPISYASPTLVPIPSAIPSSLPAPKNFRVRSYEKSNSTDSRLPVSAYVSWDPVPGAHEYVIERQVSASDFLDQVAWFGTLTQAYIPGSATTPQYVNVFARTATGVRSVPSATLKLEFPLEIDPSATPVLTPSPVPTSTPKPTPTPIPFDSTKMAILEEKVENLEQQLQQQDLMNANQTARIERTENILTRILGTLRRWFRI